MDMEMHKNMHINSQIADLMKDFKAGTLIIIKGLKWKLLQFFIRLVEVKELLCWDRCEFVHFYDFYELRLQR